jgi:hypothetical protein
MKNSTKKIIFLYTACIILIVVSTVSIRKNISYKRDAKQTILLLDSIVQNYYTITEEEDIYGIRNRKDSVIADGNLLLNNYNDPHFKEFYTYFLKEYGGYVIIGEKRDTYNYITLQTKLIQIQYLIDLLKSEHESYFQVDMIGLRAINSVAKHNKKNQLKLFIMYEFLYDKKNHFYPIVKINGDTLPYEWPYYYYDYFEKEKGEHFIDANIFVKKWNDTLPFPVTFKVIVE